MPSKPSNDLVASCNWSDGSSSGPPLRYSNPKKELTFIDFKGDSARNDAAANAQNSLMRAHVMRDYHRRQKHLRSTNLKASMKEIPRGRPATTTQVLLGKSSQPSTELRNGCCDGVPSTQTCEKCKRERLETFLFQISKSTGGLSLNRYFGVGFVDPFAATPVPMDRTMDMYFQQFRTYTMTTCYPLDGVRMSIWWWRIAQEIPALLHAIIFLSAGHQAFVEANQEHLSLTTQRSSQESVRHRGESLRILNEILIDPVKAVSEANILTVASHHSVEAIGGNVQAVDAHMKGLERLVQLQGGLETLHHTTLSKIYMSDVKSGCLKLSEPVFPIAKKWRGGILQLHSHHQVGEVPDDLLPLGTRFFDPKIARHFDKTFLQHVKRFRGLVVYHEMAIRNPSLIKPTDNDMFIFNEHQLLSLPYDKWALPATRIQECTRLGLLVYSNIRIWKLTSFPFVGALVSFLREELLKADCFMTSAPDLLFWMLFVGSAAAKGHVSRTWFLTRLATVGSHLQLRDWQDVKTLLSEFFFVDRVLDTPMEDLWKEVALVM